MEVDLKTLDRVSKNILETLKRFPLATLSTFIITLIIISIMELNYLKLPTDTYNVLVAKKIAFVASLGIFLFPALRLLFPNIIMSILGIVILSWYYRLLPLDINNTIIINRHLILMFAIFLMLFWTPFITIKISNKNIWEWTQHLILSFVSSLFFATLLYFGVALGLYLIEKLFHIDIPSIRYDQLAVIIYIIYGANLFLAQIPKYIILLQARVYTTAEEIFTKYILSNLTIGYFLIIFTYSISVIASMNLPNRNLTLVSIIFTLLAITTYLFWTPLFKKENNKFKTAIWLAILFQTIILGVEIYYRVEKYGFTENRYFLLLYTIWLFLMSLYFLFIKNASYKWLFVTATLLLIGSQFGKYSAINFSKEYQLKRLERLLKNRDQNISIDAKKKIYSTIEYLYQRDKLNSLAKAIPNITKEYQDLNETLKKRIDFPKFAIEKLGFKYIDNKNIYITFRPIFLKKILNIKEYSWLVEFNYNRYNNRFYTKDINITFNKNILQIKNNKERIELNLNPFIEHLNIDRRDKIVNISNKKLEYKNKKVKILFESITIDRKKREIVDFIAKILF
jgi:hypothetical protein